MEVVQAPRRLQLAGSALALALPTLLRRMRGDFAKRQSFRRSTATAMWGAYTVGALVYADAIRLGTKPRPIPGGIPAMCLGTLGAVLVVDAMAKFEGPAQVTGTDAGDLVTGGVYRYSRNPQYTGIVLLAAAGAAVTRSIPAAAVTVALATAYRYWVPVEEAALRRSFGDAYLRYADATPRWVGLPWR